MGRRGHDWPGGWWIIPAALAGALIWGVILSLIF
jgi:hypothetical protein